MGSACDGRRWNCARGTREEDFAAFLALYWCLVEFPLQVRMGKAHEMMPSPVRRFSLVTRLRGAPESTNLSVPQLQHPRSKETEAHEGAETCWQSTRGARQSPGLMDGPVCLPLGRVICHLNGASVWI
nr:uncharacterized protein LOC110362310 isoform X10 [Columba livia]